MIKTTIEQQCTVTSSKRVHLSERTNSGVPFYCSKEIIEKVNGTMPTETDFISEEQYINIKDKFGVPQPDDLLLTTRGTIGVPYLYRNNDKFYFADGNLTWLKDFKSTLSSKYLYYWFQTKEARKSLEAISKGTAQQALSIEGLKKLSVRIPDIKVQNRVCEIISSYDDLIENNQKQIKLLEEAAQRLYKEWFVDLRFPGYEQTKIVDGVPEGWTIETLSAIADIVMGQSPKSEFYNSNKEGLPFHQGVGSYGERFVNDEIFTTSFTRIAESFSVLFSVRAPVGRINITQNRIVIGRGLAALTHKKGFQSFLYYMLKEFFFKEDIIGNGAIFASISKEELCSLLFLNPSIDIVKKFEKHSKRIDEKILLLNKQKILLAEARDRLLPKLMNGEIEV